MSLRAFTLTNALVEGQGTEEYRHVHSQIQHGFYGDPGSTEVINRWAQHHDELGMVLRGFYDDTPVPKVLPPRQRPVATIGGFPSDINTGGTVLPAWLITAVTVAPTHRRRGLLRAMMIEELQRAQSAGHCWAALTATEATIYERFGFGVATRRIGQILDLSRNPQFRPVVINHLGVSTGTVHEADPADLVEVADQINRERVKQFNGQIRRPRPVQEDQLGIVNLWEASAEVQRDLKGTVYVGPEGNAEALAVIKHTGWENQEKAATVKIVDFQWSTLRGWAGMWQQLLNLDLVDRIEFSQGNSQVLRAALTDTRALRVTADTDMVWVRLLDVTRALEARTYSGDGALELHIDDPLEHINGIYRLTVTDGVARVKPLRNLTGAPAVHIDATQLASAVFRGSESAGQLGLISGSGVAEFDTLFAVSDEPWSDFSF